MPRGRRTPTGFRLLAVAVALALLAVTGCTRSAPVPDGFVDQNSWRARQLGYLRHATAQAQNRSAEAALARLLRAEAEPGYDPHPEQVEVADLQPMFDRLDRSADLSDFDLLRLYALWHRSGDRLRPEVREEILARLLGFRYWYTDPSIPGTVDEKWFWSENHRIVLHTLEYLVGKDLSTVEFTVTGDLGADHERRGRARVLAWLDEKARWGFSEWHSDVYYAEDIQALTLLAQDGDREVSARATVMLDVFLFDLAVHQHDGNFGVTHGRSYMKDKSRGRDQDVYDTIQLLYAAGEGEGYRPGTDLTALLLAGSDYRLPAVLPAIAEDRAPVVDRQRLGVPIDPSQPVTDDPTPPPGTSFTDPDALPFWWDRGAMTAWQVLPITIAGLRDNDLLATEWFSSLSKVVGDLKPEDEPVAQRLLGSLNCQVNAGLLSAVDTTTYRDRSVMLSSAQDYRAGCLGRQYHAWQATLSEDAVAFTTLPGNADRGSWADEDLYWNGGVMPRSAQSGSALINIYAPRLEQGSSGPGASGGTNYLSMTHAFLPTERFDEVRQVGQWTFARSGGGYLGLWSWRPTRWAPVAANPGGLTQPYDLVADGGADNVWIVQVGGAGQSFEEFVESVAAAPIQVTNDEATSRATDTEFEVSYRSPSEGELRFASSDDLTVDGTVLPLHRTARVDNPYAQVPGGSSSWTIGHDGRTLTLDLATGARTAG